MRKVLYFIALMIAFGGTMMAQGLPNTNVYLFDIKKESDSLYQFSNPKLLTDFNSEGYNNQPCFMSDDELFITVGYPGEGQTDIFALDGAKRTKLQVTRT